MIKEVDASINRCLDRLEQRDILRSRLHDWLIEMNFSEIEIESMSLFTLRQMDGLKEAFSKNIA